MKAKIILTAALLGVAGLSAQAGVHVGFSFGLPLAFPVAVVAPVCPAPVVVVAAPVCAPAPVVVGGVYPGYTYVAGYYSVGAYGRTYVPGYYRYAGGGYAHGYVNGYNHGYVASHGNGYGGWHR